MFQMPEIKAIKPENRWNMDETGIMEGRGDNGLVLGKKGRKQIQKKDPGQRDWTSFIECISATGVAVSPLVIFKGKSIQAQWYPTDLRSFKGWHWTYSDNGWTNDDTAAEWLRKMYLPGSMPKDPKDWRLLVLDGHGSHETDEFMWLCFLNKVYLIFLPPHSSHVLQPLDLAVFAPLKQFYRKLVNNMTLWSDASALGKRKMQENYRKARLGAFSAKNIKSGWSAAGLWPLNQRKPLSSSLLLENSNQGGVRAGNAPNESSRPAQAPSPTESATQGGLSTPIRQVDVRAALRKLQGSRQYTRSARKAQTDLWKEFNAKVFNETLLQARLEASMAQNEANKDKKRKKVHLDPNTKFATIRDIHRAQIQSGRVVEHLDEESNVESSRSEGDCIVVSGRVSKNRACKKGK